ncbi:MAG: protein-(glutamine-N5) methyltransferase, release factor-specific [Ferruginibacter sp.]|nr:protein-(glutamine-N5) methyltransferase, release factor-specific [Ferruginibacter sp.]
MFARMTNKELYRQYIQQLQILYDAHEAAAITERVFESVAGLQRFDILKHPEKVVDNKIYGKLEDCLAALLQHKPVQYVLGEAWFYKMKLKVSEQVLIPRPETEELVQLVIDSYSMSMSKEQSTISKSVLPDGLQLPDASSRIAMLDIGTGSGCIAIAVAKHLPGVIMFAIDVSEGALSMAKENAAQQEVPIDFLQLDFLDKNTWQNLPQVDVIISNPPYIPVNESGKLEKNVTAFEPHTALFVPTHEPLIFYVKIAAFGKTHLKSNGKIYVEINEDLAKDTREVFEQFYSVEIRKDIFGKERMLVASPTISDHKL